MAESKDISRIVTDLSALGALRAFKRRLRQAKELVTARSADDIVEALVEHVRAQRLSLDELKKIYLELRITGRKAYSFYSASSDVIARAKANHSPGHSAYLDTFPIPLSRSELRKQSERPIFVHREAIDAGIVYIFCSPRVEIHREELESDVLRPELRRQYSDVRLIAERTEYYQAYDVVFVPDNGAFVEVRGETRIEGGGAGRDGRRANVLNAFRTLLSSRNPEAISVPIELFPAVKALYDNAAEGRVVELGFECSTGAIRKESLRRERKDLRTEIYHKMGKRALNDHIDPFRVAVAWEFDDEETEASLPGSRRMLKSDSGLYECLVPDFPEERHLRTILKKVLRHAQGRTKARA